jgi:hypothetical protein
VEPPQKKPKLEPSKKDVAAAMVIVDKPYPRYVPYADRPASQRDGDAMVIRVEKLYTPYADRAGVPDESPPLKKQKLEPDVDTS